jgi:hypothetical protein
MPACLTRRTTTIGTPVGVHTLAQQICDTHNGGVRSFGRDGLGRSGGRITALGSGRPLAAASIIRRSLDQRKARHTLSATPWTISEWPAAVDQRPLLSQRADTCGHLREADNKDKSSARVGGPEAHMR